MSEPDRLLVTAPTPPGWRLDERGVFFSVFAPDADLVELCLFDDNGRRELTRLPLPDCSDGLWHGFLENAGPGLLYGYRAYGPFDPNRGLRYNPHKLLLDPYARRLCGPLRWHDALYGYRVGATQGDLSFDQRDSAPYLPKCQLVDETFDWGDDRAPRVPWPDTVIYELHARGFTRRRADLPEHERGTLAALGADQTIAYLQNLGITAIELLPVQAFIRDRELVNRHLTNYWGYNPIAWFAPEPSYLGGGDRTQFKQAVRRLHAAGIEVLLDVVYNHTGEGNELGPTLSLRGLDNRVYYRLRPDGPRHYVDETGCGNTLNFSHPRVIQLVMDSLRYWVSEFHVDGFRFDLGVTLGREREGFEAGAGFFDALLQDPQLNAVKLIFEPWDLGPGGYRLGQFPPGCAEWNGRFRDDVRRYWRGDAGQRGAIAARLTGSADLFGHGRRRPWASINFVTAHDGFTLNDLVSYAEKHNLANGEHNRDGSNDNASRNWGVEGPSDNPVIIAQRDRARRNFLITLLCAAGTPMLLAGDEFGQTQLGNNNPYCQDNALTWLDWSLLDESRGAALRDFVARLIALRKEVPLLRRDRFDEFTPTPETMLWFDERGLPLSENDWHNTSARLLCLRRMEKNDDGVDVLLLLLNSDDTTHRFHLPPPRLAYRIAAASHDPALSDTTVTDICEVPAFACVLLLAQARTSAGGDAEGDSLSGDMLRDDPEHDAGDNDADILVDDSSQPTPPGGDVLIDDSDQTPS